jgi:hypothetical protein
MFVTEEYVIDGFDMYDEHNNPVGCYFDQLRLIRSGGKHIISYELWFNNHRELYHRPYIENKVELIQCPKPKDYHE